MKRVFALLLACALLLSACSQTANVESSLGTEAASSAEQQTPSQENVPAWEEDTSSENVSSEDVSAVTAEFHPVVPEYYNLSDPGLPDYIADSVYAELIDHLDDDYFVQNVSAAYVSKELLEEISYNSKSNIFFGYTLAQLDEQFQGTRYVFTLSDEGKTIVEPFEEYDDSYATAIKNVVVGSGVILICVTVSTISKVSAPAISTIFAASAKTGSIMSLSSGGMGALASGIVTGVQTKDFDEAMKAAALTGSESFKWGAISGTISGGASEAIALKGATVKGLTMNEAATIQREGRYPLDVIKEFSNIDQYNICKEAGLSPKMVNGKTALVRDIDLNFVDEMGHTNLERMQQGLAAIDPVTGDSYQLHHIGQKADSTLAILTEGEHMQGGNNTIWHELGKSTEVHGQGNTWDAQRRAFWKSMAKSLS